MVYEIASTQTKIIWGQERHMPVRRRLRKGTKVADICCGIDLELGQKMRGPLVDCKVDDVRIEPMILTNLSRRGFTCRPIWVASGRKP